MHRNTATDTKWKTTLFNVEKWSLFTKKMEFTNGIFVYEKWSTLLLIEI